MVEVGGLHGLLPRVNLVQRLVTRHLNPSYRGRVWGRRVPGSRTWKPPIAGLDEKVKEEAKANILLGRLGMPSEIASAAVFFAGDTGAYITAQVLVVDGGMTA